MMATRISRANSFKLLLQLFIFAAILGACNAMGSHRRHLQAHPHHSVSAKTQPFEASNRPGPMHHQDDALLSSENSSPLSQLSIGGHRRLQQQNCTSPGGQTNPACTQGKGKSQQAFQRIQNRGKGKYRGSTGGATTLPAAGTTTTQATAPTGTNAATTTSTSGGTLPLLNKGAGSKRSTTSGGTNGGTQVSPGTTTTSPPAKKKGARRLQQFEAPEHSDTTSERELVGFKEEHDTTPKFAIAFKNAVLSKGGVSAKRQRLKEQPDASELKSSRDSGANFALPTYVADS